MQGQPHLSKIVVFHFIKKIKIKSAKNQYNKELLFAASKIRLNLDEKSLYKRPNAQKFKIIR